MTISRRTALKFVGALDDECRRTMKHLKLPGYPRLYYLSYLLRDTRSLSIFGRLGNVNLATENTLRDMYCDCRVGSYRYDQVSEGGLEDNRTDTDTYEHVDMPSGNDVDALKFHVWKLTDGKYREAVRQYLRKKSHNITYLDSNSEIPSFRRSTPTQDLRFRSVESQDLERWARYVEAASRIVKDYPVVKNSWVALSIRDITRILVSSEGTQVIDQKRVCELGSRLWTLTERGEEILVRISHATSDVRDLPDLRTFKRQMRERIVMLEALRRAPTLKSYAGPVLLAPGPAGILLHEVLGHRLEGSRLLSSREGQTFKRDIGKRILPPFLSVVDDPTRTTSAGSKTIGSYRYDDEGTPAERAVLVDRGRLVGFLSGRSPIRRGRASSNGHARNEYHERPISRMANFEVVAHEQMSHQALKARFIQEIRNQRAPYGIMVLDAEGGETATETYDFQAFLGSISAAVQVWPDGRENLIRNVSFVGTPLSALRTVIAAGDQPLCQNAFCGAESGLLPVSTTCPALLLTNLELQAGSQRKYAPYALPMPHEKAAMQRGRDRRRPR